MKNSYNESTNQLLHCDDDIAMMHKAVHQMYQLYISLTDVTVDDQNDDDIFTLSGKAISPAKAAHCLLEMKRTAVFIRGIHEAISDLRLKYPDKRIHILYAGSGPYAALITPLLTLFPKQYLCVDLLDINPVSLQSATTVIKKLELWEYIGAVYCTDATTFKVEKAYDLVISETMQAALKKEPQVAIMQNLIPQLPETALFIPQSIRVDAVLSSKGRWNATTYQRENVIQNRVGEVMQVNASHINNYNTTLKLPQQASEANILQLHTTIEVYGKHLLTDGDCSLNQPIKVGTITNQWGKTIHCRYEQNDEPHVVMNIEGGEEWYGMIKRKSFSLL